MNIKNEFNSYKVTVPLYIELAINDNLVYNNTIMNQCNLGKCVNQEATHSYRREVHFPRSKSKAHIVALVCI